MTRLVWDEQKRRLNLYKHGLDFADARLVLSSEIRLDVVVVRNGEERLQSFAYVFDRLAVLTVVHVDREHRTRVISFRRASKIETEIYHDWLENQTD